MQLGVIGLSTMGANLARNALRNGAHVVVYNRTREKTDAFMAAHGGEGNAAAAHTLGELCTMLSGPRAILIMVKAGAAVDDVIAELLPQCSKGDILIDGGNSHYRDTERRQKMLKEHGVQFIGLGVSGGEEGALHGPSMMAGGESDAYASVAPLLKMMSADDGEGGACVALCGPGGAGHFVKMVHNGIEYGVMQLIAESYDLLKNIGGYEGPMLAETYEAWSRMPEMESFLLEITADIFTVHDGDSSALLLDVIADRAGQKGTGKWTTESAHTYGVAIPTITAAVEARILSGSADVRDTGRDMPAAMNLHDEPPPRPLKLRSLIRSALELSTITAYAQGFTLLHRASEEESWNLQLSEIARIWRGGCIIRSSLLRTLQKMYGIDAAQSEGARDAILLRFDGERQIEWRRTVSLAASHGIGAPAMAASLAYFDSIRRQRLPQSLIQAQRDFFGAHTYERTDREGTFHTEWMKQ